jgi:transcriptional regulator with XRE-family HTH domain
MTPETQTQLSKSLMDLLKSNRQFTMPELAKELGITKSNLKMIVSGERKPSLALLMDFLNMSNAPKKLRKKILLIHFQNQLTDPDHRQQIEDLIG